MNVQHIAQIARACSYGVMETVKQWVNWKPVLRVDGKIAKIPVSPGGEAIDHMDPANWLTADQARASAFPVGFVFVEGGRFWFADIDAAWNGLAWSQLAQEVMAWFPGCAVEVSASGTGLHLIGSMHPGTLHPSHETSRRDLGVEFYTAGRFCALTGTHFAGDAGNYYTERLPAFLTNYGLALERQTAEPPEEGRDERWTGFEDDDQLIAAMLASKGSFKAGFGAKCHPKPLWEADRGELTKHWPVEVAR